MAQSRLLVFGATGQLGSDVVDTFAAAGAEVVGLGHEDADVSDRRAVVAAVEAVEPTVVVNTTAFHHLDSCEEDPEKAFAVNAIGARNVALAASGVDAKLIHISTDYVFDGESIAPYEEGDLPGPLNVYGISKLAGEHMVWANWHKSFIVRTSGLYGPRPCRAKGGLNFPSLMIKLAVEKGHLTVVSDEVVSPTYTPDLANQMVALAGTDGYGVIHATGLGEVSWYEFAKETLRIAGLADVPIQEASGATMPRKVRRPSYSILAHRRLEELGIMSMRPWRDCLSEYMTSVKPNVLPTSRRRKT